MRLRLALALVCVAGCGGSETGSRGATITAVLVEGPSALAYYSTATLTARVQGTGNFSPVVNWVINNGGGRLSASTGASVQYTAPLVLAPAAAEIFAISDADHSKVGRLAISITPAPPAGQAIAGTYDGDLHDYEHGPPTPANPSGIWADRRIRQSYLITAAGPNTVTVRGTFYGALSCSNGIPARANDDGTLVFTPLVCSTWYARCQIGESVLSGTGTWDYSGNLQFVLHLLQSSCAGNVYSDQTFTNGHKQ